MQKQPICAFESVISLSIECIWFPQSAAAAHFSLLRFLHFFRLLIYLCVRVFFFILLNQGCVCILHRYHVDMTMTCTIHRSANALTLTLRPHLSCADTVGIGVVSMIESNPALRYVKSLPPLAMLISSDAKDSWRMRPLAFVNLLSHCVTQVSMMTGALPACVWKLVYLCIHYVCNKCQVNNGRWLNLLVLQGLPMSSSPRFLRICVCVQSLKNSKQKKINNKNKNIDTTRSIWHTHARAKAHYPPSFSPVRSK